MKELSLHILDVARNSIRANASLIEITIEENEKDNYIKIIIKDNGNGMDEETLKKVTNPFFTTRKVRNVGLGIPLLKAATERCNGCFKIFSTKNVGTKVECLFERNNIDRAPLGNMSDTIMVLISSLKDAELSYNHIYNENSFCFETSEIRKILDGVEISSPDVLIWIKEFLEENLNNIYNKNN